VRGVRVVGRGPWWRMYRRELRWKTVSSSSVRVLRRQSLHNAAFAVFARPRLPYNSKRRAGVTHVRQPWLSRRNCRRRNAAVCEVTCAPSGCHIHPHVLRARVTRQGGAPECAAPKKIRKQVSQRVRVAITQCGARAGVLRAGEGP